MAALVAGPALLGTAVAQDRTHDQRLPTNQTTDQVDARTSHMRADLRLTPEQETHWGAFESAMRDYFKSRKQRDAAIRTDRAAQKNPVDVISVMRRVAVRMSQRSVAKNALADAAQPLFASLNDIQKRQFSAMLVLGNEPDLD